LSLELLQTSKPVLRFGGLAATRTGQETAVAGAAAWGFRRRPLAGAVVKVDADYRQQQVCLQKFSRQRSYLDYSYLS
jgi:hypothetical protein